MPFPSLQSGTGLLCLEQGISVLEVKNVLRDQLLKWQFQKIQSLVLDDRRISAKKIEETRAISRGREGYIIKEISDMRKLSAKWAPICLNAGQ
jgi:hypothetical protein